MHTTTAADTTAPTADTTAATPWRNRREACSYLRISDATMARAIAQGRVRVCRIFGGQKQRFHVNDLDAFLMAEATPSLTPNAIR